MSVSGLSNVDFWLNKPVDNIQSNTATNINKGGDGARYLSYDIFLGLSILGGFLALDHLYLRSPLTFIAKLIVNILFFGVWWIYDASQAFFNKDSVKIFGLGIPGLGSKRVAKGVLSSDVPDKKHMSFFIYALGLLFTGLFGIDSFILGDKQSGFIRLISLISIIFTPIAIFWWLYRVFKFFFNTKSVIEDNHEYFGAPMPEYKKLSLIDKIENKVPFLGRILRPVEKIKDSIVSVAENTADLAEAIVENPVAVIDTTLSGPIKAIESIASPIIQPIANSVESVTNTAKDAILLGRNIVNKGSNIAENVIDTVGETSKAATAALAIAPMAAKLSNSITKNAIEEAKNKLITQTGGSIIYNMKDSVLTYALVGTIGFIIVSGLIVTYNKLNKNAGYSTQERDDKPPEPGIFRESTKEESY